MILPKKEGGLGVRNLPIITSASYVKRASKFLDHNESIFTKLLKKIITKKTIKIKNSTTK